MAFAWTVLPDPLLMKVFSYLDARDLTISGMVCSRWRGLSLSHYLWRRLLETAYQLHSSLDDDRPCYKEYRRLAQLGTPRAVQVLEEHLDEVWHVTFSHDGTLLAAGGKQGRLIVWDVVDTESIKVLWQLDGRGPPVRAAELMYMEFSSNDELLLVSASVSRQNMLALAFVCDSRLGTVLLVVQDVFIYAFASWFNNSWFVTSYFRDMVGGNFIISLLSVEDIRKSRTCVTQDVRTYRQKVIVVDFVFYLHGVLQLQHCMVAHTKLNHSILFCQINMDSVDHFASISIETDVNGKPSVPGRGHVSVLDGPRKHFDLVVPLDGHVGGVALAHNESKVIASVSHSGSPTTVEVCMYDVVTLQLLHRLPSENIANPQGSYYLFPDATEEAIAW